MRVQDTSLGLRVSNVTVSSKDAVRGPIMPPVSREALLDYLSAKSIGFSRSSNRTLRDEYLGHVNSLETTSFHLASLVSAANLGNEGALALLEGKVGQ